MEADKQFLSKKRPQITQIRRYVPKDLEAVKILLQSLAKEYNDEFNEYFFKSMMQVRTLDTSVGTFVAEYEGHVKGTLFADTERDPRGVLHGRISNVIVSKDFQGKGIGSALVDEGIGFLSLFSIPAIWANVNTNNKEMMKMFEKRDFNKYFVVMEKYLDPFSLPPTIKLDQSPIRYRSVVERDLRDIKSLVQELAQVLSVEFDTYWFDLTVQKYFQDPTSSIFIAEKGGKILGTTFADVRRDPLGYMYGMISNIIIGEDARGQGVGSNLLELATSFLSKLKIQKIWGNVNYGNENMIHVYEKQGYEHKFTVMKKLTSLETGC
ncbi:MAG: hypothetical protein RBG13Loki_1138 [Promethearchaeota archaeon CR_4]|nr:MAG: hypothetical protein RBG13Loki_1138 [Candidatus Lokiarchaeota archaeon CR_4]